MAATEFSPHADKTEIPALVFLHYFGGSGASWNAVLDALPDHYPCVALDLCGFGKSHCPDEPMGVEDYADYVLDRIRFLALKRYILIGHSMGGKVAMALAARQPEGLQSLVLVAPSPPTPEPMEDAQRKELAEMFRDPEKIRRHLTSICAAPLSPPLLEHEVAQQLLATHTAWQAWLDRGSREDISSQVRNIEVPAVVLGGVADKAFTPDFLKREVVAHLSSARLQVIVNAGHLLPMEQPAAVADAMETCISGQEKAFYA